MEEPLYCNPRNNISKVPYITVAQVTSPCRVNTKLPLPWHPNPAISAFHGLTGAKFDFRAHPIAPAGTAILIHEPPESRGSWASHGVPGFYLGPAVLHYRSHHVFVTATSATRITDTVAWFPETDITRYKLDPYCCNKRFVTCN